MSSMQKQNLNLRPINNLSRSILNVFNYGFMAILSIWFSGNNIIYAFLIGAFIMGLINFILVVKEFRKVRKLIYGE